ncbi:fatty-acid amide hydrolase 2 [Anopheles stephensi]|uniref:fatty-acid amide hydrolase 2 n=1 Tax=Anopheles stephensi TaxID=30069 RepID=UPI001658AD1E|nr:fatty-acid amide hydrolase 2 [Anopheles stephensi]XP_035910863.1 fatty-acid amide hydrolase 2 [Anopheles stephensi]XP_035910864.1 fatty-acid amide hydrolase 2 [Anopheles stephensi]
MARNRLLVHFFTLLHLVIDKLLYACLKWYWGPSKQRCPTLQRKRMIVTYSAVELARMIRTREVSCYDVISAFIDRLNEVNPLVNAVLDGPFIDALDEARRIDERLQQGAIGEAELSSKPFLGVPFTTKDSTAVKDRLHTLGIVARRTVRSNNDAECVRLLKEAGAIIIATTSIPEINRWQETRNNIIGQTNNPYDNRRTVGGSSGGEGALLAVCGTPIGLGTDIGGSIRMPAFYCGVYGHKPTTGIINTRGCSLRTGREPSTMVVAGPMTRYATDLLPLMKVLVGPEKSLALRFDEPTDVRKLRYFYIAESGDIKCSAVQPQLQKSMDRVVEHFSQLAPGGVQRVTLSGTDRTTNMWRYWMTQEPANFGTLLGNGKPLSPLVELAKKLTGRSEYTMASIYSLMDTLLPQEKEDVIKELTRCCDQQLTELLGDDGVLFYHSTTHTAPYHYAAFVNVYNFSYWCLFNVLHVPATQVPLGLDGDGLPLGIQIVASRNRDRHCLAVAEEIERVFNGRIPPFIVE